MKILNQNEVSQVNGGFFDIEASFSNTPGWGWSIGSAIGSKAGVIGTIVGGAIGHAIENTDYNKMAKDYADQINDELKNSYIPAD